MKAIYLPFYSLNDLQKDKENLDEDINSHRNQQKLSPNKCYVAKQLQKNNDRHPFYYQLQYYYKIKGLSLPQEIYNKIYFIKFLSIQDGFIFQDFLSILTTSNNFLFDDCLFDIPSISSENSLQSLSKSLKNGQYGASDFQPQIALSNYEQQITSCKLSEEDIKHKIQKFIEKKQQNSKKSLKISSFSSNNSMLSNLSILHNTESLIKLQADYKLPSFKSKGFLACPKELRSQIIEFLENNQDKPYSAAIQSLMYFYGIDGSIQQSNQLGQNFLKQLSLHEFFDFGQYIIQGIEYQNSLLADIIYFALNCCEGENENEMLNDELPFFIGSDFASTKIKTFFCKLDQEDEDFLSIQQVLSILENKDQKKTFEQLKSGVSQFMKVFLQILINNHERGYSLYHYFQNLNINSNQNIEQSNIFIKKSLKNVSSAEQEFLQSILNQNQNVIGQFAVEFLIKFGLQSNHPFDFNNYIELLYSAADNLHLKAYTKLATILFNQYNEIDSTTKQKLMKYLEQGCKLLIPSCMKVQIQLKIIGDHLCRDYQGAYQLMKELFFLGSDCFRYDLVRLAKHFKDFSFLNSYIQYLSNLGEKNIEILNGLILEKGYGALKNLDQAEKIYKQLFDNCSKQNSQKFDLSLNYRMGKLLLVQGKTQESLIYFNNILEYSKSNYHKLDIICLYKIGKMHEKGLGTPQNFRKAEEVYSYIINNDREKILQNSNFNPVSSSLYKHSYQQDRAKFSTQSTKSVSLISSNYDKLSALDDTQVLSNLNKINIDECKNLFFNKKCETKFLEITTKSQEKLWEVITKNLTVRRRLEVIKNYNQEKIEESDSLYDLDEFESEKTGFDTHYFAERIQKPQIKYLRQNENEQHQALIN
ncbi:hypothetical protein ABPG72_017029 [Tetrahymena utriculariae]